VIRLLAGYAWLTHSPIVGMPATPDPSTTSAALSVEGSQF
jgi:hypothetical protein